MTIKNVFILNEMQAKRVGEDKFSVSLDKKEIFALIICLHDYAKANPGKQVYGINPEDLFKTLKDQLGGVRPSEETPEDRKAAADKIGQDVARQARRSGIR